MTAPTLERRRLADLPELRRDPFDEGALEEARDIVEDVRHRGVEAVRKHAERLGDLESDEPLFIDPDGLERRAAEVDPEVEQLFRRTADRIRAFADAQREALDDMETSIPGGRAGHDVAPVPSAGCYVPGGRYPLPSTALMTGETARTAGVEELWFAAPTDAPAVCAAASIAGADGLINCGGAQAIAALAFGADRLPAADVVVGPGNRWVTAAKKLVAGRVEIDMLAGPSELVVFADASADPAVVAADLLAQAEHDPDALPVLVSTDGTVVDEVERALASQLEDLPTAETARAALDGGFAVTVDSVEEGVEACDRIAPEHLELLVDGAEELADRLRHYGSLFVGARAAEVLGDYGAGPNHTLPTGGAARSTGGLSVFDFLRVRTWMRIDDAGAAESLIRDAADFAEIESLEGHARSARRRLETDDDSE
ncbi:MAG: histidinol dehydrogenase [Bradymonadaceae bacterium]